MIEHGLSGRATARRSRLTPLDASFLFHERPGSPQHFGGVCWFDGELSFRDLLASLDVSLARLPRMRERLVSYPLHMALPHWRPDECFDVRRHVRRHHLPPGADSTTLVDKAAELVAYPIDRRFPLWEFHYIGPLPDGRSALLTKFHHTLVDGIGSGRILATLFPPSSGERRGDGAADRFGARTSQQNPLLAGVPSGPDVDASPRWISDSVSTSCEALYHSVGTLAQWARSIDRTRWRASVEVLRRAMNVSPPARFRFNRRGSAARRLAWTEIGIERLQQIRRGIGGTINDLALAALVGALARYVRRHRETVVGRSVWILVPVSVRGEHDEVIFGNYGSLVPLAVRLDVDDPLERFELIQASMAALKASGSAEIVHGLVELGGVVPAPLQAASGPLGLLGPFSDFNIVCSNIPGPRHRLEALGVPMTAYFPYVPIRLTIGVSCTIFGYCDTIYVGFYADAEACPDLELLRDVFDQAFDELEQSAARVERERVAPLRRQAEGAPLGAS